MIPVGKHEVTILQNSLTQIAGKDVIKLQCEGPDFALIDVLIWLTEKSMGIARHSLKLCGFDVDARSLIELAENPECLHGQKISVTVEEYNGQLRAQMILNTELSKKRVAEIQRQLRSIKKTADDALPSGANIPLEQEPPAPEDEDLPF